MKQPILNLDNHTPETLKRLASLQESYGELASKHVGRKPVSFAMSVFGQIQSCDNMDDIKAYALFAFSELMKTRLP